MQQHQHLEEESQARHEEVEQVVEVEVVEERPGAGQLHLASLLCSLSDLFSLTDVFLAV